MKFSRFSAAVLVAVAPVIAHAQLSQFLGAIHSARDAINQPAQSQPQQSGQDSMQDDQKLVAQAQARQAAMQQQAQQQERSSSATYRAQVDQRAAAAKLRAQQMVAADDAADVAKYNAMQQQDQQQAQQQLNASQRVAGLCSDLNNSKYNRAEQFIRCRNKGMSEAQEMTYVGGFPLAAQPYLASMVQDVYEDDITDPRKGKAIGDYYLACAQRGTPCARSKW
jgi:hypothetical protein